MIERLQHRTVISYDTDGVYFVSPNARYDHALIQQALPDGIGLALEMEKVTGSIPKSKNYLLLHPDGKIETKGLFRKRNKYPLERDFPVDVVKAFDRNERPQDYLERAIAALENNEVPIDQLRVRRKIAKSEKAIVEAGLGQVGDVVEYYVTEQLPVGRQRKSRERKTLGGDLPWAKYYVERLVEQFQQICPQAEIKNSLDDQLTLALV
jgi:DNA polymerase elongation subunit (family B)